MTSLFVQSLRWVHRVQVFPGAATAFEEMLTLHMRPLQAEEAAAHCGAAARRTGRPSRCRLIDSLASSDGAPQVEERDEREDDQQERLAGRSVDDHRQREHRAE